MAKRDYYDVLGVPRAASEDDIRRAYRKLARQYHPDMNKAADASAKFSEVQEAYDTLSDPQKRKAYDQFGHAAAARAGGPGGDDHAGGAHYTWSNVGGQGGAPIDMEDLGSMFETFFGGQGGGFGAAGRGGKAGRRPRAKAARPEPVTEYHQDLTIDFSTAARGGTRTLRVMHDGKTRTLEVNIPRGVADGARLRVRGGGPGEGQGQGQAGDIILTIHVTPHPFLSRGAPAGTPTPQEIAAGSLDLYLDLPLTFAEAALGANVHVPTLDGSVDLTVPAGTASGRKLRLRGRGIDDGRGGKGDLYAVVRIVPPEERVLTAEERAALQSMAEKQPDLRSGL